MEYATVLDKQYYQYIHTNEESKKFFFLMSPGRHSLEYIKNREYFDLFKKIFVLSQIKATVLLTQSDDRELFAFFDNGFPNYNIEFNENGDRVAPYLMFRPLGNRETKLNYPEETSLAFLNDFSDYASTKKAKIVFYFSHFPEEQYKTNEKYINAYYDMMKKLLKFPMLNKPSDFMYPEDYFADTIYHLNEKGEKIRSAELIRMLKKVL